MKDRINAEILVVDDNDSDAELTFLALNNCHFHFKIHRLLDGAEAIDYVMGKGIYANREKDVLPDLILLDFKIPKIDGLQVLKLLKTNERTKHIPVIILTSSKSPYAIQQFYKNGANSYIEKSLQVDKFFRDIEQACDYWLK